MKSFIAKRVISILVNWRYLRFKLLKYKENKKNCNTFDHKFKNIPLYIMRKISLERYYLVYDGALTLKVALNPFFDKTLHIHLDLLGKDLSLWFLVRLRSRRAWTLFKMFRWELEGRYRCTKFMAIAPFWFSTKRHWTALKCICTQKLFLYVKGTHFRSPVHKHSE